MKLRIAHFPQIPCEAFYVDVESVACGVKLMDILAEYDAFQFQHRIKPDYANVSELQMFDITDTTDGPGGSWVSWCDEESGEDDPATFLEGTDSHG